MTGRGLDLAAMMSYGLILTDLVMHSDAAEELIWSIECGLDGRCPRCGYRLDTGRHVWPWLGHGVASDAA